MPCNLHWYEIISNKIDNKQNICNGRGKKIYTGRAKKNIENEDCKLNWR